MILFLLVIAGLFGIAAIKNKQQTISAETKIAVSRLPRTGTPDFYPTSQDVRAVSQLVGGGPSIFNPPVTAGAGSSPTSSPSGTSPIGAGGGAGSGGLGGVGHPTLVL